MKSLKLSNSGSNDEDSTAFDDDRRFENAERHRGYVIAARENLEWAKKAFQAQQGATKLAVEAAEAAKLWLQQLEGGWGAPIAWVGPATLYEFWLQVPGYDGPVRGFSASTSQTGQIQHISRVSSQTTSGAGCATLGCCAAGPPGAILGAILGKKNDVRTDVDVVDNRRFEIQVIGPSVAWSYVGNYSIEESVRSFRDLLIARSTNTDDPKVLALSQRDVVAVKNRSTDLEYMKLQDADDLRNQAQVSYESAWNDYESIRLPVRDDLLARWKRCTALVKIAIVLFGPVLTAGWLTSIVYSIVSQPFPYRVIGVVAGLLQILLLAGFVVYYRVEARLIKTLPSESPKLQSLFSFIGRFKKGTPAQSSACPKCGNEVVAGANFCVFCSTRIN